MFKSIRKNLIFNFVVIAAIILMLVTVSGVIIGKRIAELIERLEFTIGEVGKGDLTAEYSVVKRKDEISKKYN